MTPLMKRVPSSRRVPLWTERAGQIAGAAALVVMLGLLATLAPAASASSYGGSEPLSWTNGLVFCQFATDSPSVGVSAWSLNGTGVMVSFLGISEMRPDQSVAAMAELAGLTWTVSNLSTEDAFDLAYAGHALLVGGPGSSSIVGSTNLSISFVLPAYQGSGLGPADVVTVVVQVTDWSWQATGDHLAISFGASPSFPTREHLNTTSAPGWLLASTANATGSELERVGANSTAIVTSASGSSSTIDANASVAIASPALAKVSVVFSASAGTFSALTFAARVGIVLPATVAGVPIVDFAAAGFAAVLVSLLVAVTARRLRNKPSTLVYSDEEERP